VSSAPENVTVSLVTNSTIALHWLKPSQPNGLIAGYRENPENKNTIVTLTFPVVIVLVVVKRMRFGNHSV
jgi:hypothetical protein